MITTCIRITCIYGPKTRLRVALCRRRPDQRDGEEDRDLLRVVPLCERLFHFGAVLPAESEQLDRWLHDGPHDERVADDEAGEPGRPDEVSRAPAACPRDGETDEEGNQIGEGGALVPMGRSGRHAGSQKERAPTT